MNSVLEPHTLEPKTAYEEVGQNYRKFLDWREKIVGGYVATIGGLGVGYHQSEAHPGFQSVLLFTAILTSLAFWILNMRNSKFIFTCVCAGQKLEHGGGVYTCMGTLTHTSKLTHGLAVNLLVFGVVVGSVFGLWSARSCWWQSQYLWPFSVCVAVFALLVLLAEKVGDPVPKK
jgi:hypothetical protein